MGRAPAEFDAYRDRYREAVEESIAFAGAGLDFFTSAKAKALLDLAAKRIGTPAELSFLDVGCGPGETDRFLAGRVGLLAGVDISPEMVERAREQNPWAEYRHYTEGEPIPYPDAAFDISFAVCVIHHVEAAERSAMIAEIARTTRRGGLVVVFEHNPYNPLTRRAVSGCEFDRDAVLLPRHEAKRLLEGAGLERVGGRYMVFFSRDSAPLRRIERGLGWVPLGAQYVVSGLRP